MPKLKTLSGRDLVRAFGTLGFVIKSQRGSHIKLSRGSGEILIIPMHREIRRGTLLDIYKDALQHVSDEDLRAIFFTE